MFIMKGNILLRPLACGVLLMILTGCLSWRDATRALNAQVILIVVTSLALGNTSLLLSRADSCF